MRRIGLAAGALAIFVASNAAAEWKLNRSQDPFDDDQIVEASMAVDGLEIRVQCKGVGRKQTFRAYFLTEQVLNADPYAYGNNWAANSALGPQITAKLRFDSAKATNIEFFAEDDWKGFWTGEKYAARIVRSFIRASKLALMTYGADGDNRVFQLDLPTETQAVRDVMATCGQEIEGKDWL